MKNVIIIQHKANQEDIEAFTSFKELCLNRRIPYHTYKAQFFPITWQNYVIRKLKVIKYRQPRNHKVKAQ